MKLFGRSKGSITRSRSQLHAWSWMQQTIHCCIGGLWQVRRTIVVATLLYGLVLLLFLPFICTNLPYCKLYRSRLRDFQSALEYNDKRVENAYRTIATLKGADTKRQYDRHKTVCCPRFAIGVITTRRGSSSERDNGKRSTLQPNYLTQVMAQLHRALENATLTTALFMCNVDAYHAKHKEFHALTHLFPHWTRYEGTDFFPYVETYEKEKLDYKYCLREALKYNPEYVILVEDDAYPHLDFLSVLEHILKTRIETPTRAGEPSTAEEDWLWLKLNFPDSLSFFERNWYFALEWIALSLFISGGFTLFLHIHHLCRTIRLQSGNCTNDAINPGSDQQLHIQHMTWLYLVFILGFLLVFLCLLILERPYFTRLRSVSKHLYTLGPGTSCCTPAVLFPAGQVPYIIGYLQHIRCNRMMPLDFALEDYRIRRGLRQYLVSPNLFRHIGMYSSLTKAYNKRGAASYLFLD